MNPSTILSLRKTIPITPSHILSPTQIIHQHHHRHRLITRISCSNTTGDSSSATGDALPPSPPPIIQSELDQVRFKRRSNRKRSKKYQEDGGENKYEFPKREEIKGVKNWESMTLTEKALELYVGEKGLLFWINKFAYASIYIIIGAWILFRFVGPALNLYQLDAPPLSPTDVLKGSS